jgi:hypothetical protein
MTTLFATKVFLFLVSRTQMIARPSCGFRDEKRALLEVIEMT